MGWMSFPMHDKVSNWFKSIWVDNYEVLDSALVKRNTLYGAVKEKSTGDVFCAVYLIRWSRDDYNFSYKPMTEHVGPYEYECPERIFKLLTPLTDENDVNGYAGNWRQKVIAYHNDRKQLRGIKNQIIKVDEPITFTNGGTCQYFKKVNKKTYGGYFNDGIFTARYRVSLNLLRYKFTLIPERTV